MMLFFAQGVCGLRRGRLAPATSCEMFLEPHFAWQRFAGAFLLLSVVTAAGILLLLVLGKLLRIRELDEQIARLWLLAAGAAPNP